MSRVISQLKPILLTIGALACVLSFQNCSPLRSSNGSSRSPGVYDSGGGVDGMKYLRAGICADQSGTTDEVVVSADYSSAYYLRQNCQDLTVPVNVPASSLQFAVNEKSVFVLNDGIFAVAQDGSALAPPGTAQYPSLLANYLIRPKWKVAGVDYPVGPSITALKDPASISIPGVTVDQQQHQIIVNADNVTLDGYDFSLAGGWSVIVGEQLPASNTKIVNSYFKIGANKQPMLDGRSGASNLYVGYCTFDSNNTLDALGDSPIFFFGSGLTVEYSWLKNSPNDFIEAGGGTIVIRYNLFNNSGQANNTAPDWIQLGPGQHYFVSDNNTFYQTAATSGVGTAGLSIYGQNGTWTIQSAEVLNNTIVTLPGAEVSYDVAIDVSHLLGTALVRDNYVDASGSTVFAYSGSSCALGSCPASSTASSNFLNNLNMVTGAPFPNNP